MTSHAARNRYAFGVGTIGRDMVYAMVSMFLIVFLSEVLDLDDTTLLHVIVVLTVLRVLDAVNDPLMGWIVDNIRGRWGKFKPAMAVGAVGAVLAMLMLFSDPGLTGVWLVAYIGLGYLLWDLFYGVNDIAYWSMLPSLTTDRRERERTGAFARICANIGLFSVVVAVIPVTNGVAGWLDGMRPEAGEAANLRLAWLLFAAVVAVVLLVFTCVTLAGVREDRARFKVEDKTTVRDLFGVIGRNDQLLWLAASMSLFMIGYTTTVTFGPYYFKYAFGDEDLYAVFALVLGVAQLGALVAFPALARRFTRRSLYTAATVLVVLGYLGFWLSPTHLAPVAVFGGLLFVGQGLIQILMLMFLADSIEYGQWKLGARNESITFSVQPFINKLGAAAATGIVGVTLVVSGINEAEGAADVTPAGLTLLSIAMFGIPLVAIVAGYLVYRSRFRIDADFYEQILTDLRARGDLDADAERPERTPPR